MEMSLKAFPSKYTLKVVKRCSVHIQRTQKDFVWISCSCFVSDVLYEICLLNIFALSPAMTLYVGEMISSASEVVKSEVSP